MEAFIEPAQSRKTLLNMSHNICEANTKQKDIQKLAEKLKLGIFLWKFIYIHFSYM